jgi:hypothetical protein
MSTGLSPYPALYCRLPCEDRPLSFILSSLFENSHHLCTAGYKVRKCVPRCIMHKTVFFSLIIRVEMIFAFPLQKSYLFVVRNKYTWIIIPSTTYIWYQQNGMDPEAFNMKFCITFVRNFWLPTSERCFVFSGQYLDTVRTFSIKMCTIEST